MPDAAVHSCVRKLNDVGFEAFMAGSIKVMIVGDAVFICRPFSFVYFT